MNLHSDMNHVKQSKVLSQDEKLFDKDESLLRNFTHITIPAEIWLRMRNKCYLLEKIINHYYFNHIISNDDFKELLELGIAEKIQIDPVSIKKILLNKTPQRIYFLSYAPAIYCEWCKSTSYILQCHHYPVRKENGGIETVKICASCHSEYHFLESQCYRLKDEILNLFNGVK